MGMRYTGSFIPRSRRPDNREDYKKIASDHSNSRKVIDFARKQLLLYDRFPPDCIYSLLKAHEAAVYGYKDLAWQKSESKTRKGWIKIAKPDGELELIVKVDFGSLIRQGEENAFVEEVVDEYAEHQLPNGEIIRGKKTRKVPLDDSLRIISRYLDMDIDFDSQIYSFNVNTKNVSAKDPFELHVRTYIKYDEVTTKEDLEIARMVFERVGGEIPGGLKFRRWVYSRR